MPTPPLPKPAPDLARGRLTLLTLLRNPVLSLVLPILCLVVMGLLSSSGWARSAR